MNSWRIDSCKEILKFTRLHAGVHRQVIASAEIAASKTKCKKNIKEKYGILPPESSVDEFLCSRYIYLVIFFLLFAIAFKYS